MGLLTRKRVAERYDIHPHSVPRLVKQGRLPAPIHPFPGSIEPRWVEGELDEHDARCIAARDAKLEAEGEGAGAT